MPPSFPAEVRSHLIDALQLDLIGPTPTDLIHAEEILDQPPSKWYLTGFLAPHNATIDQRSDDTSDDELDAASRVGAGDDEISPEKPAARKGFFPSSMGVSLLVPNDTQKLIIHVSWGDYTPIPADVQESVEA